MPDGRKAEVAVVGGGIAGIAAALELAKRGYSVTLYERSAQLGGNLGAVHRGPAVSGETYADGQLVKPVPLWHDVYPHMFSTFYRNFWRIVEEDLGWRREEHFEPRDSVKVWKDGEYYDMTDGTPLRNLLHNIWKGPVPPADMLVYGHSMLDIESATFDREKLLDAVTVNGFLESRPYATERAAKLHDFILMVIWSAHSYWVPAAPYKDFFSFTRRDPSPLTWVLRGNLHECLMQPLRDKLESDELGVRVETGCEVVQIEVAEGRVQRIYVQSVDGHEDRDPDAAALPPGAVPAEATPVEVDHLIVAANPQAAARLFSNMMVVADKDSPDFVPPHLGRRARAEPILVLDLYLKRKVPGIPREHVSVWDSPINLTFLDISQVWDELQSEDRTVLTVAASNTYGFSEHSAEMRSLWEQLDNVRLLDPILRVLPQIRQEDIDWDRSAAGTLYGPKLFINTAGSELWRPTTVHEGVSNLFLAGAYVRNPVGMATVEGAVTSGLQAAQALQERAPRGRPVEILEHRAYPPPVIHAMKLATMPVAYQAKWWSAMSDLWTELSRGEPLPPWRDELASLWSLPADFAVDYWKTAGALYGSTLDHLLGRSR